MQEALEEVGGKDPQNAALLVLALEGSRDRQARRMAQAWETRLGQEVMNAARSRKRKMLEIIDEDLRPFRDLMWGEE